MAAKLGATMANVEDGAQQTFAFAIKNPMVYIASSSYNWSTQDNSINYLWNDKNVDRYADGKSIFDPSPIGWRVPMNGVWSDFPTNATVTSSNVSSYTLGSTGTANYYTTGQRSSGTSGISGTATAARLYTSTPSTTDRANYMQINNTAVSLSTYTRTNGLGIRSVRE